MQQQIVRRLRRGMSNVCSKVAFLFASDNVPCYLMCLLYLCV